MHDYIQHIWCTIDYILLFFCCPIGLEVELELELKAQPGTHATPRDWLSASTNLYSGLSSLLAVGVVTVLNHLSGSDVVLVIVTMRLSSVEVTDSRCEHNMDKNCGVSSEFCS